MSHKFKVGDKVKIVSIKSGSIGDKNLVGNTYTLSEFDENRMRFMEEGSVNSWTPDYYEMKLITNNTTMNNVEKFALIFKSEPQKSFRKAGITNGDDLLTEDGQKIFLSWLLTKNQDAFKTEVVDELLKEEEKK